jgi:hypothetical protein
VHCRAVVHMDMDAYYVSVARRLDPRLIGVPVGVQQKYLVVTCSHEARAKGVGKLMGLVEARKLCPEMRIVPGEDLTQFRRHSDAVLDTLNHALAALHGALHLPVPDSAAAWARMGAGSTTTPSLGRFWAPASPGSPAVSPGASVGGKRAASHPTTPLARGSLGALYASPASAPASQPPAQRRRLSGVQGFFGGAGGGGGADRSASTPAPGLEDGGVIVIDGDAVEAADVGVMDDGRGGAVANAGLRDRIEEDAIALSVESVDEEPRRLADVGAASGAGGASGGVSAPALSFECPVAWPPGPLGAERPAFKPCLVERLVLEEFFADLTAVVDRLLAPASGASKPVLPIELTDAIAACRRTGSAPPPDAHEWEPPAGAASAGVRITCATCDSRLRCAAGVLLWLRRRVTACSGGALTCCGGVGSSKLMAKLASGCHKPSQQTTVLSGWEAAFLAGRPIGDLPGEAAPVACLHGGARNRHRVAHACLCVCVERASVACEWRRARLHVCALGVHACARWACPCHRVAHACLCMCVGRASGRVVSPVCALGE